MASRATWAAVIAPFSRKAWQKRKSDGVDPAQTPLLPSRSEDHPGGSFSVLPRRTSPPGIYGSTEGSSTRLYSPERIRRETPTNLNIVPEDETLEAPMYLDGASSHENDEDWELEEELLLESQGLYKGTYRQIVLFYSVVPISTVLSISLLVILPAIVHPVHSTPTESDPLPSPIPELVSSAAFWSLSYLLRDPIYSLSSFISSPGLSTLLSTTIHAVISIFLRLALILIIQIHGQPTFHDPAFRRVWWLAIGWASAEAVVAIKQGYDAIALYQEVLVVPVSDMPHTESPVQIRDAKDFESHSRVGLQRTTSSGSVSASAEEHSRPRAVETDDDVDSVAGDLPSHTLPKNDALGPSIDLQIDHDLDQLVALKGREELEEVYGIPFIQIPVFLSCLQRLNSVLLSLGLTLLLSAAYFHVPSESARSQEHHPLRIVLPLVILLHIFLSILHTHLVLPKIGVHTVVYVGLIVSLGTFFAGLGMWEALS